MAVPGVRADRRRAPIVEKAPRPPRPGELVFNYALLALSLFLFRHAYAIDGFGSPSSAGAFPLAASALMAATALLAILHGHRSARRARARQDAARGVLAEVTPRGVVVFAAMVVVYALTLDIAGFHAATFLFLTASIRLFHGRGLVLAILVALAALGAIHVVFQLVFAVVLPQGGLFR
jgi:putative tricarboxylic transport membrane protein